MTPAPPPGPTAFPEVDPPGLSDGELVRRYVLDRDEAAFACLVVRHHALVLGVAERILRSRVDAEDVAQAVFLTLARKGAHMTRSRSLAAWLHHVARCVARTALAARSSRGRHEARAAALQPQGSSEARGAEDLDELRARLDEALARLPARYREPLILVHLEGRSLEDTSQILGRPVGTIGACLSRGRALLRTRLGGRGGVVGDGDVALALAGPVGAGMAGAGRMAAPQAMPTAHGSALQIAQGLAPQARILALSDGAIGLLRLAPLKLAALSLAAALLAAGGAWTVATQVAADPPPRPAPPVAPPAAAALREEVLRLRAQLDDLTRERVSYAEILHSRILQRLARADQPIVFDSVGNISAEAMLFFHLSEAERQQLQMLADQSRSALARQFHLHGAHGEGGPSACTAFLPALGVAGDAIRVPFTRTIAAVLGPDRGQLWLEATASYWDDQFLGFGAQPQSLRVVRSGSQVNLEHRRAGSVWNYSGETPRPALAHTYALFAPYLQIDLATPAVPPPLPASGPAGKGF